MRRPLLPVALALAALTVAALSGCGGAVFTSRGAGGEAGAGAGAGAPAAPGTGSAAPSSKPASPQWNSQPPPAGRGPRDYDPEADAGADLAAALAAAKQDGRPVLIDFGADWCVDCRVLGVRFRQAGPAALLAKYHVVKVDVGEFDRNLDVAERYVDLGTSGIPALAVLDPASGDIKVATNQGEFSSARSMSAAQVEEFLKRWL
ncbi:co-chaperone YbbN [Streptomyces sp. NBC_00347]|uniref:thioredoxin family protein n=1 Tax=Streptomyces sp. NBC_00347 TaxID=2975721 RepID=UPI002251724B|nr:thioredoxin family protein [Streptomyces sp. NBC_00347]MCX5127865.1 thioredoxin family protein [Streptomyces sp. NBC_00347]